MLPPDLKPMLDTETDVSQEDVGIDHKVRRPRL
jgi:hypothetical protein